MPNGVPTFKKLTDRRKTKYLEALRRGVSKCSAARSVGVSPTLICLFRQENPDWADLEDKAQCEAHDCVEDFLFNSARDGNVTAQQVWLYNRRPDRWQDKRNINAHVSGGLVIQAVEGVHEEEVLGTPSRNGESAIH